MKKLMIILFAAMSLSACGDRNKAEATHDDDTYENSPAVTPQDNVDTTSTNMEGDTTRSRTTTGSTSGSGLDGSDTNGTQDQGAPESSGTSASDDNSR